MRQDSRTAHAGGLAAAGRPACRLRRQSVRGWTRCDVRTGLRRGEFAPYFHPRLCLTSGVLVGEVTETAIAGDVSNLLESITRLPGPCVPDSSTHPPSQPYAYPYCFS